MYKTSDSQFLKTTTGIQLAPDTCDKLRLVMTLLTILVVTEIVCSVTLVLEEKTVKEIPELSRL